MQHLPIAGGKFALVDDDTYIWAKAYVWSLAGSGGDGIRYPARGRRAGESGPRTVYLHRLILGERPTQGLEVDHCNGDPLDARRENLRWVRRGTNIRNRVAARRDSTSGYRNVYWQASIRRWRVRFRVGGRFASIGSYATLEVAREVAERHRAELIAMEIA